MALPVAWWQRLSRHVNQRVALVLLALGVALTASAHFIEREWAWAGWLGQRVPASWVQAASARTLERLDTSLLTPSALPVERQNAIVAKFSALRIPHGEAPLYALVFRHGGSLGARSFTLAGGQIVVTDELVAGVRSERDLFAALAVQLGHLHRQDALRSSVGRASTRMLIALFRDDAEAGTRLMSDAQPVLAYKAHAEEAAREFGKAVMQANP